MITATMAATARALLMLMPKLLLVLQHCTYVMSRCSPPWNALVSILQPLGVMQVLGHSPRPLFGPLDKCNLKLGASGEPWGSSKSYRVYGIHRSTLSSPPGPAAAAATTVVCVSHTLSSSGMLLATMSHTCRHVCVTVSCVFYYIHQKFMFCCCSSKCKYGFCCSSYHSVLVHTYLLSLLLQLLLFTLTPARFLVVGLLDRTSPRPGDMCVCVPAYIYCHVV